MEKSARSLVDHWTWAADKGVMNRNTAAGLRSACTRVLEVNGTDWDKTDISSLDVEAQLIRFQNLRKRDFRPQVLEVYKQRFRKALASYLDYLQNPGAWKPATQERPAASQRTDRSPRRQPTTYNVYLVDGKPNVGWLTAYVSSRTNLFSFYCVEFLHSVL